MAAELHTKAFGYLIIRSDTESSVRLLALWYLSYDVLQLYWYVPALCGTALLPSSGKIWTLNSILKTTNFIYLGLAPQET